ncbi:MAG: protease family protein [Actinomycetota bacterium]|nr:protease family protein [Actinomycetota bacterium]
MLAFVLATLGGAVGETIAVVVSGTKSAHGVIPITAPVLAGAVVGQYGAWLAWIYAASRFKGFGNLRADFGLVVDVVRDWAMLPLGLGFEIVAGIVILPISNLRSTTPQEVVNELEHARGAKLAVLAVTAVLIAPVVEELFFRGLLLRSLQRRVPAPTAVAISALAFGLAHVVFDFGSGVVLPALVALGMISGILAVRTGNLSRSILLHAGFNLFAVLAVLTKR